VLLFTIVATEENCWGRVINMSLTSKLIFFLVLSVLGTVVGILKRNKVVLIISVIACILLMAFILFLVFVLIPSMGAKY